MSLSVPSSVVTEATQSVLPEGRATVLLTSDTVGSAEVLARLAGGNKDVQEVDLVPGRTVVVRLPKGATLVQVTPRGGALRGVVVAQDGGATVLGLHDLVRTGLVPDVRPALP